jgi:hypothetical protein
VAALMWTHCCFGVETSLVLSCFSLGVYECDQV